MGNSCILPVPKCKLLLGDSTLETAAIVTNGFVRPDAPFVKLRVASELPGDKMLDWGDLFEGVPPPDILDGVLMRLRVGLGLLDFLLVSIVPEFAVLTRREVVGVTWVAA